jgi:hypothetical protein
MPEPLEDNSAEIERLFLWDEITTIFRKNADLCGIQLSFDLPLVKDCPPTRLVLVEPSSVSDDTLMLWAEVSEKDLISTVSILYLDPNGTEVFNYEITPEGIQQYSECPTALDQKDLMEIRFDVRNSRWDDHLSKEAAKNILFFA